MFVCPNSALSCNGVSGADVTPDQGVGRGRSGLASPTCFMFIRAHGMSEKSNKCCLVLFECNLCSFFLL